MCSDSNALLLALHAPTSFQLKNNYFKGGIILLPSTKLKINNKT
jgi:hypothetical protein